MEYIIFQMKINMEFILKKVEEYMKKKNIK